MREYFIDNIQVFFFSTGVLMGTNCSLLLAHLFLHSYDFDFITDFVKGRKKEESRQIL